MRTAPPRTAPRSSSALSALGLSALVLHLAFGCDGGSGTDAGPPDAGPRPPVTPAPIDYCAFEEVPPTGGAGGTVTSGALEAGVAEGFLNLPLGTALGAYTARAEAAGAGGYLPDGYRRSEYLANAFSPSIGIETWPRIGVLALRAGGETAILIKVDLGSSYQGFVHDLELRLGPEYTGKIIVATSHSHSTFGNYTGHTALAVGFSTFRSTVYTRVVDQLELAVRDALDAMQPAQIGFSYNGNFDPDDRVNRDRRGENDDLAGGREDDHHLFMIRVDAMDGTPMAALPVFGMHGTLHGEDNAIISTDAPGGVERVFRESFDSPVVVMHLQGAGGDVSPAGSSTYDCMGAEVCTDFGKPETVGHYALAELRAAYDEAGTNMVSATELEMVTRDIALGPDWETFTIRDGTLAYAPFDLERDADNEVFDTSGNLISPIDEFNAPFSAALCSPDRLALIPRAQMPNTNNSEYPYRGCNRIEAVARTFETIINGEFEGPPICESTRTTVTALRIGDHLIGTLPGEPMTLVTQYVREHSPVAEENTIVIGYAQDHGGYILLAEDWLSGGYEPEITFWGPLEGEYVVEQLVDLFPLVMSPEREDANADGMPRPSTPTIVDDVQVDTSPIAPGTVPASVPAGNVVRLLAELTSAQPAPSIHRLESVYFTWVGSDPLNGTPTVHLQREDETNPGTYADVLRASGRPVTEGDLILTWTPDPLLRQAGTPRTHYYTVEFQAVAPLGTEGADGLAGRLGLPTGNYRFHVVGPDYTVDSDPFAVDVATLLATTAAAGADLDVTLTVNAPTGFRVLDLMTVSNGPVPLRSRTVSATVDGGAAMMLDTDGDGTVRVPGGAGATSIVITDAYGNTVTVAP
ncbi:MAG: neutral/alkaline non-lysosomal ceramidase N-terminal domain-containing protein [Sandaracinaceae bacterium]